MWALVHATDAATIRSVCTGTVDRPVPFELPAPDACSIREGRDPETDSRTVAAPQISSLIQRCEDFGMPMQQLGAVRTLLLHAGADK